MVIDEQFKKDMLAFRSSPYSFNPSNKNWTSVLKMMHNREEVPLDGTRSSLFRRLEEEIKRAYNNRDIDYLKKVFPTAEDLIAHGSALWIMTHKSTNKKILKTPTEFIKDIFKAYDLDNRPELKKQLLLQRGPNGKYATDNFLAPVIKKDLIKKTNEDESLNLATDFMRYHNITINDNHIIINSSTEDDSKKKYRELTKIIGQDINYGLYYQTDKGKLITSCQSNNKKSFEIISTLSDKLQEKKDSDFNVYAQHETYLFLKEQIKSVLPEPQIEEIHRIGTQYEDKRRPQDKQADGTPVSGGWWLTDKEGNPVAYMDGTIKETYPEFRLRNIGDENKKEQTATLRDLDPYSDKSLVEQVVDQLDFPDDFTQHFNALSIWEKDYQEARKDEQRFAYIRYFTQNKGAYIFEDKKDPKHRGNGKGKGDYGGYAGMLIDNKNGERYSRIVCRSDLLKNNPNKTFFHELYHRVDLHNGLTLSNQDITQFSFMLAQTNNNNLFKNAFQIVDECYPPSEFNKEVLAQIMSYETDEHFKNSDLLKEFYKTGKLFALAKADKVPAMEHRIQHALYDMPELNELNDMYKDFMKDKEEAYKEEKDLKSRYSNEELVQKLNIHRNNVAEKNKEKNQKNEPKRAKLEAALLKRLKKLNQNLNDIYQNKEIIGNIISPPNIINKYQELSDGIHINYEHQLQNLLPKEITQKTLSKQIDKFKYSFIDEQPHSQFLHLYTTIDTLNKLGYSNLPNIPTIDNLPKSFDELMASPEKKEALIDRLNFVSEEIRKGTDQTNLQLACLFNKPSEQLTEDDKLIGYLKRDYAKSSDHKTLAQTFIKKLEENGYNPTEISEKVFGNIDYDNNDNEIIKEISFPKNKIKANRIIDYLDQNYTPETLGIIAITGLEGLEKIPPEKRYRKPCIVAREDGCPIMFRSEYEAQKYIENYNKNKEVKTQVIPPHQQEDSSHKLSDTLKKYSQQTIQNHSVPVEKPNVPKQPMQQNNSPIQKLITPLKNGSR